MNSKLVIIDVIITNYIYIMLYLNSNLYTIDLYENIYIIIIINYVKIIKNSYLLLIDHIHIILIEITLLIGFQHLILILK